MSTKRGFAINLKLIVDVRERYGITGDEFLQMVHKSAIVTSPHGQRRYHEWYFTLDEHKQVIAYWNDTSQVYVSVDGLNKAAAEKAKAAGVEPKAQTYTLLTLKKKKAPLPVESVVEDPEHFYKCETCKDTKTVQVSDVCAWCHGEGCKTCGGQGETPRLIPCPDCGPSMSQLGFPKVNYGLQRNP